MFCSFRSLVLYGRNKAMVHLKIPDENNSCYRRIHANSFMQIVLQDWTTDKYARAFPVAFFDLHLSIKH